MPRNGNEGGAGRDAGIVSCIDKVDKPPADRASTGASRLSKQALLVQAAAWAAAFHPAGAPGHNIWSSVGSVQGEGGDDGVKCGCRTSLSGIRARQAGSRVQQRGSRSHSLAAPLIHSRLDLLRSNGGIQAYQSCKLLHALRVGRGSAMCTCKVHGIGKGS